MVLAAQVQRDGSLGMGLRQRADAVRRQELGRVEHPGQDPSKLPFVEDRQQASTLFTRLVRRRQVGEEVRLAFEQRADACPVCRISLDEMPRDHRHGTEREQPDHGADLEPRRAAVREAEDVVEEPVVLVPQLVLAVADPVHRGRDREEVLRELDGHLGVERIPRGQLEGHLEHVQAVERHPRRAVGLFEVPPSGSGALRSNNPMLSRPRNPP